MFEYIYIYICFEYVTRLCPIRINSSVLILLNIINLVCVRSYGEDCRYPCSKQCVNKTCNRFNGWCVFGCHVGFKGAQCFQGINYNRFIHNYLTDNWCSMHCRCFQCCWNETRFLRLIAWYTSMFLRMRVLISHSYLAFTSKTILIFYQYRKYYNA